MPTLSGIGGNSVAFEKFSMRNLVLHCTALVVIVLAVYIQAGNYQFVALDDDIYVTENPHVANGLTGENIIWAFTSIDEVTGYYLPITWLSHMADVQFFGMNPRGHHLTNVVIHIVSSILLLLLLFRITNSLWESSFVAFLFALHPLHVESVAWVAERKDVISAFFWFLTLLIYSEFTVQRKPMLYFISLCSFILGLMSKPMLVTLPVVMLLMDFWPLDRYRHEKQEQGIRQLIGRVIILTKEKIPFFFCALFSSVVTIYAQNKAGAVVNVNSFPAELRIENALLSYVKYIGKTLWPNNLAVYYPYPLSIPLWQVVSSLVLLLLLSATAIRAGRRHPYLAVGWLWFIVSLLPVIGLIQAGGQSMADRFSYIPAIGLFIIAAWGVSDLMKSFQHRQGIYVLFAAAVIFTSAALTWHQLGYWRDSISLFRHTLQITSGNSKIHYNLGVVLAEKGDLDSAIKEYQKALWIRPNFTDAHHNLGLALANKGNLDAAIREFQEVLQLSPNDIQSNYNLGVAFAKKGDVNAAIKKFQEVLQQNPDHTDAQINLGRALVDAQKSMKDKVRK